MEEIRNRMLNMYKKVIEELNTSKNEKEIKYNRKKYSAILAVGNIIQDLTTLQMVLPYLEGTEFYDDCKKLLSDAMSKLDE